MLDSFSTRGQQQLHTILTLTQAYGGFAVVGGANGIGKSHAIERFTENNPATQVITASVLMTKTDLGRTLAKLTKPDPISLLICDETDWLLSSQRRKDEQAIEFVELFLEAHDSGFAVALIGTPELLDILSTLQGDRLHKKLGFRGELPLPSREELLAYWIDAVAEYPQAISETDFAVNNAELHGYFHLLSKLAKRTLILEGDVLAGFTCLPAAGLI